MSAVFTQHMSLQYNSISDYGGIHTKKSIEKKCWRLIYHSTLKWSHFWYATWSQDKRKSQGKYVKWETIVIRCKNVQAELYRNCIDNVWAECKHKQMERNRGRKHQWQYRPSICFTHQSTDQPTAWPGACVSLPKTTHCLTGWPDCYLW